jgi:hypothetical protein
MAIMVWVGLTEFGATPVKFIDNTLDGPYYTHTILPFAKRHGNFLFSKENKDVCKRDFNRNWVKKA